MGYPFSNNSCNPWIEAETPCILGGHVAYSSNVSKVEHIQAAVHFVNKHNIRLVIRATRHDYLGKSTGAHALAIWTQPMKNMTLMDSYEGRGGYSGPAIKVSAGTLTKEACLFAKTRGLAVVGGNRPKIALAGGYAQGAGHGPFASRYGLAADQVLEWAVITANGSLIIANAHNNTDIYWSRNGGGGGTYGIVAPTTIKAFPDSFTSVATTSFQILLTQGAIAVWVITANSFTLTPVIGPGVKAKVPYHLLNPVIKRFEDLGLDIARSIKEYPSFLDAYNPLEGSGNISDYNLGGRLIPRDLIINKLAALVGALRSVSEGALIIGVGYNVAGGVPHTDDNAVNIYFRQALFGLTVHTPINYTNWEFTAVSQNEIT